MKGSCLMAADIPPGPSKNLQLTTTRKQTTSLFNEGRLYRPLFKQRKRSRRDKNGFKPSHRLETRERRPGEGTGQCCYETRETDGKRKEQSERDEGDGVRKVGTEGGQGRRSDNAAVLTHRFTRAVGPPFCPALIGAPLKILLRFHKNQTAASE